MRSIDERVASWRGCSASGTTGCSPSWLASWYFRWPVSRGALWRRRGMPGEGREERGARRGAAGGCRAKSGKGAGHGEAGGCRAKSRKGAGHGEAGGCRMKAGKGARCGAAVGCWAKSRKGAGRGAAEGCRARAGKRMGHGGAERRLCERGFCAHERRIWLESLRVPRSLIALRAARLR